MFENLRILRHLFLCLCVFICHKVGAVDDLKELNYDQEKLTRDLSVQKRAYSTKKRPHHSFQEETKRKKRKICPSGNQKYQVRERKVYPRKQQKISIYSLFSDLEHHLNLFKVNNQILFRETLTKLKAVESRLAPNTKIKLNWYQGYYLIHSQSDLAIFEGLKLLTHTPKAHEFNTNHHNALATYGFRRLCDCLSDERLSSYKSQYDYLIDYIKLMLAKYPNFFIADYDFGALEQTFNRLSQRYHCSFSEIINDFKNFAKIVDTDKLTHIVTNFSESDRDEDGVYSSDDYYTTLFRLLLEPIHRFVREQNKRVINYDQPHLISEAIPVPQQAAVICDHTIPLATGNVCDCVAVYAYTLTSHGLAHYDRYCTTSDLQKFINDIQKKSGDDASICCHLITTRFTTQLQRIYGFLKETGMTNIDITVSYPSHFFSQQSRRFHSDGCDYYTNLYDGPILENYKPIHITCVQGAVIHGKTKNTIASKEMVDLRIKTLNAIVNSDNNRSNAYLGAFFRVFKEKYKGIACNLKYLY
ncbi:MAG TPA: hypothetical protein VNJ29_00190 [Candidatus Nitrosotenuis sp.]|jgi:hypothetical protein|nr:hypothetical protein [Candidatus Nitrosotenuis sp.]